jgi:hypothetical protein
MGRAISKASVNHASSQIVFVTCRTSMQKILKVKENER